MTGKVCDFCHRLTVGRLCHRRVLGNRVCNDKGRPLFVFLIQALLKKDAKVWIAGRSLEKAEKAMEVLKEETGNEKLFFLQLDLADITSAAAAARELVLKEERLDILFNNA